MTVTRSVPRHKLATHRQEPFEVTEAEDVAAVLTFEQRPSRRASRNRRSNTTRRGGQSARRTRTGSTRVAFYAVYTLPSIICTTVGISPRRFSRACRFSPASRWRYRAHGETDKPTSTTAASEASTVFAKSTAGQWGCSAGRARACSRWSPPSGPPRPAGSGWLWNRQCSSGSCWGRSEPRAPSRRLRPPEPGQPPQRVKETGLP